MAMLAAALALAAGMPIGCDRGGTPTGAVGAALPTVTIRLGSREFVCEVAATEQSRERGLMHRKSMPQHHGMIFVFERAQDLSFWMRNTEIPLDIVFVNEAGRVLNIESMKPFDEWTRTTSLGAAKYAIELNAGAASTAGVQPGEVIAIPDAAASVR